MDTGRRADTGGCNRIGNERGENVTDRALNLPVSGQVVSRVGNVFATSAPQMKNGELPLSLLSVPLPLASEIGDRQ